MPETSTDTAPAILVEVAGDYRSIFARVPPSDISPRGVLLRTGDSFAAQTEVSLNFVLPISSEGLEVSVRGVVARSFAGVGMAIVFTHLREDQRVAIATFLERYAPKAREVPN